MEALTAWEANTSITLEATNVASGESLGRQQAQADRKEDVLNALHGAATKLRGQLGESLFMVQKYDISLSQATTSSLDALKALSLGDTKHRTVTNSAPFPTTSTPSSSTRISLWPTPVSARSTATWGRPSYPSKTGRRLRTARSRQRTREALHHVPLLRRQRTTRQRHYRARTLSQTYPRDSTPFSNLAGIYNELGQFDKALDNAKGS